MEPFHTYQGIAVPLDRSNVDTDAIIPKQYLKSVERVGFGVNLFDDWRYLDKGSMGDDHSRRRVNPEFILNQPRYASASVLLARENFACGSSREHAVWALLEYGLRTVIAPSFADIFHSNAIKNGLLPVVLAYDVVDELFKRCARQEGYMLEVNLAQQLLTDDTDQWHFDIDAFHKRCLMEGLDEINLTLQHADAIVAYEQRRRDEAPWLFTE